MNRLNPRLAGPAKAAAALLLGAAMALGACSGPDAKEAERIAEMNAAVQRAEKAAERAEAAAKAAGANSAPVFAEEPEPVEPAADAAPAELVEGPAGGP